MIQLDLSYFYKTGEMITPLTKLSGDAIKDDIVMVLYSAREHLDDIIKKSSLLKSSYADAVKLRDLVLPYADFQNLTEVIPSWKTYGISAQAKKFETTLNAELAIANAYIISPKGGYDVGILLTNPSLAFPLELFSIIPETKYDVEQAAKCLTFEVPTAAGFHLHRINEAVVHRYWDAISKGNKRLKRATLGQYIEKMIKAEYGDEKILSTLQQINILHRNPVLHPENNLTVQEAIELFGIIVSAVSSMLPAIKDHVKKGAENSFRALSALGDLNQDTLPDTIPF